MELEYERSKHAFDLVCKEETTRQSRLRILLLENENDDLHHQLAQDDDQFDSLEKRTQELLGKVETLEADLSASNADLRIRNREIESLKTEVKSLQGVSMDSTKLLTEKLALSRDLAAIAPEVEHLRSQVASHQTLLADKLSLQRQLSTVQVELETEKRAAQRALAKEGGRKAQDAQLTSQIEELQAEVAKERRLRQKLELEVERIQAESESKQVSLKLKAERELQQAAQEAENAQTMLSSRLDAFRTKLRVTKEQLKGTQEELNSVQIRAKKGAAGTGFQLEENTGVVSRKRSIAQVDGGNIGTPDGLSNAKRLRQGSTVPGDKSMFSVTPFLNRTASVAPESPPSANSASQSKVTIIDKVPGVIQDSEILNDVPNGSLPKAVLSRKRSGNASAAQPTKAKRKIVPATKGKKMSNLEQVQEEETEEDLLAQKAAQSAANLATVRESKDMTRTYDNVDDTTFIRRKRKLLGANGLGRTLFDEMDGTEDALGQRGPSAQRKPASLARKATLVGTGSTAVGEFGAISPLKKDKRWGKSRE